MFDPRDPFERIYWHYDSRRPLSLAQLINYGSVDIQTAALIWLMLEKGSSFIVAGPTDPRPGVGKTTVLNALFQLLPENATLAYTAGMYEDFAFTQVGTIQPEQTYVLCNEISDHQPFYMWGRIARQYLHLPEQGYRIATSVHADTIDDVVSMLRYELRLSPEAIRRLGLVIHIEVIGSGSTARRRWISTHFFQPEPDPTNPGAVIPIPLSTWNVHDDSFEHADQYVLDGVAEWAGVSPRNFAIALNQRVECLQSLAARPGVNMDQMYQAISSLRKKHLLPT